MVLWVIFILFLLVYILYGMHVEELGKQCSMDLEEELNWNPVIYFCVA